MFEEAIAAILDDACTPAAVRAIEAGGSPQELWSAMEDAGFLELLTAEADGGAGLPLPELFPILRSFGHHAVPVPVAQTICARALIPAGDLPRGMVTFATALMCDADGALCCPYTPYGLVAQGVLARDGDGLLLLDAGAATREADGVYGSQAATLRWASGSGARRRPRGGEALTAFAAALHAALLSGAMTRAFGMTLQYCNDRVQFGKSLGKFQAVQHQLSVMAQHTVAASIAAEAAFRTQAYAPTLLAAAMAKSRTSEAAALVAATAHALHGAIGVTEEYDLQLLTRRLHDWRGAHGSEAHWNLFVGEQVLAGNQTVVDFVRSPGSGPG